MAWEHGYAAYIMKARTDEVGETAEVGELPEGKDEAVSTLPELRVWCDSQVEVLLLSGVAVSREKASPWMTCYPLEPGDETRMGSGWE